MHTAYTFANESRVLESGAAGNDVPMGALINMIQVYFVCFSFVSTGTFFVCQIYERDPLCELYIGNWQFEFLL